MVMLVFESVISLCACIGYVFVYAVVLSVAWLCVFVVHTGMYYLWAVLGANFVFALHSLEVCMHCIIELCSASCNITCYTAHVVCVEPSDMVY